MLTISKIAEISRGKIIAINQDYSISTLLTDSRKIILNEGAVFFAIKGSRHDGHLFIKDLYLQGLKNFVVEENLPEIYRELDHANIIQVGNCIDALQQIAAFHRLQFDIPIIAITGSNGKTIVKEWLAQLLSRRFNVAKSPKSYNSQVGVPLSVWQLNHYNEVGIFEAGISKPGEMEKLETILKPDICIFTNIGTAHDEGFENRQQKVSEKAKLFGGAKTIIYCKDHEMIHAELSRLESPGKEIITWSAKDKKTSVFIEKIQKNFKDTELTLIYKDLNFSIALPFKDDASIENCMHCITYLLYEGFPPAIIQKSINELHHVGMRLELKQGINDCYIIDDSYNNDLAGLAIALDFQNQQKQKEKKTIILSDILESGLDAEILYSEVARILKAKGVSRMIGIGKEIAAHKHLFKSEALFFSSTDQFIQNIKNIPFQNEIILVKGARVFRFEKVVNILQEKIHGTVLEINLDALTHNLNFYRSRLHNKTRIMVMVKAFAYGSGSHEIAHLLQFHRVDYLAVAYTDEGVALRKNGIKLPIMVMNPSVDTFEKLLDCHLEPEIYSLRLLNSFLDYLKLSDKKSKIHLKIDTGMHRLGFVEEDIPQLVKLLKENPIVKVASIFSHLAGADSEIFNDFSHIQAANFTKMSDQICDLLNIQPIRHFLNSAGIIRFPEYHFDMVRLGIGLYGVEVNQKHQDHLRSISTLKTIISQIKKIKKGDSVGYSRKGIAEKDSTIATIAIGYADGYDRRFGNGKGQVLINGVLASTIGNVCMDMTMIDITGVEAREGDEVIVFGEELPITELARIAGTIPYEILTNIGERVKRVFYSE